ncbi:heat shock factor-binding protein 1 [Cricetulus griseus]|nr:heat shock factor-binding protein 1 [Cricetulus griseus]
MAETDPKTMQDITLVVETLLQQMQDKFQIMSDQIIGRNILLLRRQLLNGGDKREVCKPTSDRQAVTVARRKGKQLLLKPGFRGLEDGDRVGYWCVGSLTVPLDDMSSRIDDLEKNIADLMTQAGVEELEGENKIATAQKS